jgi:hypothetical protein
MEKKLSPLRLKDIAAGAITERAKITAWLRSLDLPSATTIANWIEEGYHDA